MMTFHAAIFSFIVMVVLFLLSAAQVLTHYSSFHILLSLHLGSSITFMPHLVVMNVKVGMFAMLLLIY